MPHAARFFALALLPSLTLASLTDSSSQGSDVKVSHEDKADGLSVTGWASPSRTSAFDVTPVDTAALTPSGQLQNSALSAPPARDGGLGALISVLSTILNPQASPTNAPPLAPSPHNPGDGSPAAPLPIGPLVSALSSLLSVASGDTPAVPGSGGLLPPVVPTILPTPDGGVSLQPLLSAPSSIALPLPGLTGLTPIATVVPTELSGLVPSVTPASLPLSDIPALISEITAMLPTIGDQLPSVMPFLTPLESVISSELAAAIPQAKSLSDIISSAMASLTSQVFSAVSAIPTEMPVMSVKLPSLTFAVPVPTNLLSDLANAPLPTNVPLSQLAAKLSSIIGPGSPGLASSIVEAVVSTLDGLVLSSQMNELISEATVAAGTIVSVVTQAYGYPDVRGVNTGDKSKPTDSSSSITYTYAAGYGYYN
ncbi:hypothetical protein B0T14DRAFT_570983 [Immersiella caudata]|uniref:Uncharacterized protein n=1 Tax=Immersiella caudata TaxID=314043 RepID=A0AA39TKV4_9PEZI|nr:hypothetical protein B0T14DRAFT_570983 [Immersiella caudata]